MICAKAQSFSVSIHAPRVEGDLARFLQRGLCGVSIHAPRVEGDLVDGRRNIPRNVSIHAPRVEGDITITATRQQYQVSIHAPRVEGDLGDWMNCKMRSSFNPRPPGGGRQLTIDYLGAWGWFQSTPPGWRATY